MEKHNITTVYQLNTFGRIAEKFTGDYIEAIDWMHENFREGYDFQFMNNGKIISIDCAYFYKEDFHRKEFTRIEQGFIDGVSMRYCQAD